MVYMVQNSWLARTTTTSIFWDQRSWIMGTETMIEPFILATKKERFAKMMIIFNSMLEESSYLELVKYAHREETRKISALVIFELNEQRQHDQIAATF